MDVTFLVDENGMLTVTAKEQRSGQQASVTVQPAHGLSPDEVEKLVLESVEHAHEDFTARRLIELRNKGEADVRYTEARRWRKLAVACRPTSGGESKRRLRPSRRPSRLATSTPYARPSPPSAEQPRTWPKRG